ncbi:Noranthrone monooxygenase [Talaromyces pinophilus]|nr:Noranthrone monooxygenase [Talaromyces pinophilus]
MSGSRFAFRIAQAVGFTGAAWLSGNIAALSANAVPVIVTSAQENNLSPKVTCKLWRNMYEAGKTQNPPIAIATASAFAYVAWSVRRNPTLFVSAAYGGFGMYTAAAVLTLSIVPYTLAAMRNTNDALLKLADSKEDLLASRAEVEALLDRWTTLNWIRSLLPLAGGLAGIAAALL